MARLFLSHASEDEAMPAALVDALRQEGFAVWWDKDLKAGEAWAERIDLELGRADCVVICWSRIALKPGRQWVRGEAESVRDRAISVLLDDVDPPLPFNMIQSSKLRGWNGDRQHEAFRQLVLGIQSKVRDRRHLSAPPAQAGGRRALLVGVGTYGEGAGLIGLPAPVSNVAALEQCLRRDCCGFRVTRLGNPTKQELESAAEEFFAPTSADELLLIYFSGHVLLPDASALYLTGSDSEQGKHRARAFSLSRLERDFLADCKASHLLLIFDVCCADASFDAVAGVLQSTLGVGRSLSVLVSTHDAAPESRPLGEHTTRFTAAIVRALESDDADSNHDGVVTADELFNYLSPPDGARRSKFRARHWSFSSSPSALSLRRPTGRASDDLVLTVEQSAFVRAFVKELGQRKVIPFLGDGIYGTGPLSFFQIARTLAQEAGINGERHQDMIATAAESLELHMQDRCEFLGRLAEIFESQAAECSPPLVHDLVASMAAPWLVVSVNYDSLLERRLDHLQRPYVILSHVLRSGCSEEPETKDREAGKILLLRSNHHPLVKEDPAKAVQLCTAQDVVLQPDDCVIYKLLGSPCWHGRPQVSAQRLDTVVITESDHIDFLVHLRNETTGMPPAISQKLRIGKLAFFEYNLDIWHYRLIGHLFRTGGTGHLLPGSVVLRKTPYMLRTPTSPTEELFWRRRFNPDRVPADLTTFVRAVESRMGEP